MPPISEYYPDPNTPAARQQEEAFENELRALQTADRISWDYYNGDHRDHLRPDGTNTNDNVKLNKCDLIVDMGVSNLMGTTEDGTIQGPDFDISESADPMMPPGEQPMMARMMQQPMMQRAMSGMRRMMGRQEPDSPAETYLDRVLDANKKALFLHNIAVNGGVCGRVYVKIVPDGVPDPDAPGAMLPRLIALNPSTIVVGWADDDAERTFVIRVQWGGDPYGGRRKRQDIVRARSETGDDLDYWIIRNLAELPGKTGWTLEAEEVWERPWPPIIEWQNLPAPNAHYGKNDLGKAGVLNDGLNFVASNMQRIIKYHAHPATVATGASADQLLATDVNRLWAIESADAKVYNVEMQSDLASSISYLNLLQRAIFDGGRELDPDTIHDKLGQLTNFGLRVLYRNSLEKVGTKRLLYGAALVDICQHVLELGNFAGVKVTDKWPDPLPRDPLATAQALQIDRANGLSQSTYLEKRGYDPDVEARNRESDIGESVLGQTMARQGTLVDSMRGGTMQQGMMMNGGQQQSAANGNGTGMDRRGARGNG